MPPSDLVLGLLAVALSLLIVGAFLATWRRAAGGWLVLAVGCLLLGGSVAPALRGAIDRALPEVAGLQPRIAASPGAAMVIIALSCAALAVALHAFGLSPERRPQPLGFALSVVGQVAIVLAADPVLMLFGWGVTVLATAALLASPTDGGRSASNALVAGLLGLLILSAAAAIGSPILYLLGFALTAGLPPFGHWLAAARAQCRVPGANALTSLLPWLVLPGLAHLTIDRSPDHPAQAPWWLASVLVVIGLGMMMHSLHSAWRREQPEAIANAWSAYPIALGFISSGAMAATLFSSTPARLDASLVAILGAPLSIVAIHLAAGTLATTTNRRAAILAFVLAGCGVAGLPPLSGFMSHALAIQSMLDAAASNAVDSPLLGLATIGVVAAWFTSVACLIRAASLAVLRTDSTPESSAHGARPIAVVGLFLPIAGSFALALAVAPLHAMLFPRSPAPSTIALLVPPCFAVVLGLTAVFALVTRWRTRGVESSAPWLDGRPHVTEGAHDQWTGVDAAFPFALPTTIGAAGRTEDIELVEGTSSYFPRRLRVPPTPRPRVESALEPLASGLRQMVSWLVEVPAPSNRASSLLTAGVVTLLLLL